MPRSNHDPEALLERLEWTVIRRLDWLFQGDYRTIFRGFGLDLADLRAYQPGEDVRYLPRLTRTRPVCVEPGPRGQGGTRWPRRCGARTGQPVR